MQLLRISYSEQNESAPKNNFAPNNQKFATNALTLTNNSFFATNKPRYSRNYRDYLFGAGIVFTPNRLFGAKYSIFGVDLICGVGCMYYHGHANDRGIGTTLQ